MAWGRTQESEEANVTEKSGEQRAIWMGWGKVAEDQLGEALRKHLEWALEE